MIEEARTGGPRRPGVTVFVVGGQFVRLVKALNPASKRRNGVFQLFRIANDSHGNYMYALHTSSHRLTGSERVDIDLRSDVHRGHAGACALLSADATKGVDADLRLAAVHARREGLHRFVVLIEQDTTMRGDEVERDIRVLLTELGVEGDACPVLRVGLRLHERDIRTRRKQVLAMLDELPAFLAPDPLIKVPPAFAAEAAQLDVVGPLYAEVNCPGPTGPGWTLPAPGTLARERRRADARLQALTGQKYAYERMLRCTGAALRMSAWQARGRRFSGVPRNLESTPHCRECNAPCVLVYEFQAGTTLSALEEEVLISLWACEEHPFYTEVTEEEA